MILHAHPLSSFCWKVLIALYESGTEFEYRHLDFGDQESTTRFRELWPIAKMPVLEDGAQVIAETSIIIEHLALRDARAAALIPREPEAALRVRLLDRVFDCYVMIPVQKVVGDRLRTPALRDSTGVAEARAQIGAACAWLDGQVVGREWAAGDAFTLADCAAAPSLHYAHKVRPLDEFQALMAYLDRLESRPSVARVLAEAEPWKHLFPLGD